MIWWMVLGIAAAHEVVVFGDSWAEGSADELAGVIARNGRPDLTVDPEGIGGTTAVYWNDVAPDALVNAVSANPDARWVWLSILGNDTFAHHAASEGSLAAGRNEAELREMFDRLFAVHPDIQVAIFSYDYVNFEQSIECIFTATLYFPELNATGRLNTFEINSIFERDIGQVQARVAADYPQVSHFTFWGALQLDAGTFGAPTALLPSPASRMSDCIHPTSAGYTVMHEHLWDAYWNRSQPTASLLGPTEACAGEEVVFTDTSTGTDARRWTVDGQERGSDLQLRLTVQPGPQDVRLWVANGAWTDTELVPLQGVQAPTSLPQQSLQVCDGEPVQLDAGRSDVRWTPADGLDDPLDPRPLAAPTQATTYTAAVDGSACEAVVEIVVEVGAAPEVDGITGPDTLAVEEDGQFSVAVDEGATVTWTTDGALQDDGATAHIRWEEEGTYEVIAEVAGLDGCTTEVRLTVDVVAEEDPGDGPGGGGKIDDDQTLYPAACTGCASGALGSGWWLGLGLLGWRRRRR